MTREKSLFGVQIIAADGAHGAGVTIHADSLEQAAAAYAQHIAGRCPDEDLSGLAVLAQDPQRPTRKCLHPFIASNRRGRVDLMADLLAKRDSANADRAKFRGVCLRDSEHTSLPISKALFK